MKNEKQNEVATVGHSPAPWHVDTSNGEFRIVDSDGGTVLLIGDDRRLIPMLDDRALIVLAPELLAERDGLKELLLATQRAAIECAEQRDALAVALRGLYEHCLSNVPGMSEYGDASAKMRSARAALALVEGKAS